MHWRLAPLPPVGPVCQAGSRATLEPLVEPPETWKHARQMTDWSRVAEQRETQLPSGIKHLRAQETPIMSIFGEFRRLVASHAGKSTQATSVCSLHYTSNNSPDTNRQQLRREHSLVQSESGAQDP